MSILTSDLACCASSDKVLHLFFQEGQNIREARSPDGGAAWTTQEIVIAKDGEANGSAMTCYYVDKDANFDNKPSIHLLYLNKDKELMEKVKRMEGENPIWQDVKIPEELKKRPEQYSKLTGEAFNENTGWNPNGSQWAYFSAVEDNKFGIIEIRRTPKHPWHTETVLPEKFGDQLPGASLACTIKSGNIKIFFQHHDYSIRLYESQDNKWYDRGVYVEKDKVQPTTPLACTTTKDGSVHLFFAGREKNMIIHCKDGKQHEELVAFFPGSRLGATSVGNKLTLFYRNLDPVGEVSTLENDSGSWKHGSPVIQPPRS